MITTATIRELSLALSRARVVNRFLIVASLP